jgi:hypothetical protein
MMLLGNSLEQMCYVGETSSERKIIGHLIMFLFNAIALQQAMLKQGVSPLKIRFISSSISFLAIARSPRSNYADAGTIIAFSGCGW